MSTRTCALTPTLYAVDPRASLIRTVEYCRHPDSPDTESRVTRQSFDNAGRPVAVWDPRLWSMSAPPIRRRFTICWDDRWCQAVLMLADGSAC